MKLSLSHIHIHIHTYILFEKVFIKLPLLSYRIRAGSGLICNTILAACSGWSYSAWQGPFYPSNMDNSSSSPSNWLKYYASVFDYVEINSSFYRTPNVFTVKNWFKRTPEHFRFTAKFPKVITHDKRLKDVSRELEYFLQSMLPLREKTLALLIQLPPSLKVTEGIENLRQHVVP